MSKRKANIVEGAAIGAVMELITEATDVSAPAPMAPSGDVLDGLLSDLTDEAPAPEEVESFGPVEGAIEAAHSDEILEEVEEDADRIAARQQVYERQGEEGVEHLFGGQSEADQPATAPAAKGKRVKLTDEEKAARKEARDEARREAREKKAAEKAALPPKAPRPTSITHKPGDLLVAKLGAKWREFVVFTDADASLGSVELERVQDAFIERMNDRDAIADKVREKAIMLFSWLKAGGELNEVMRRAFTVLHEKGELTSGDKGNLQLNLLSKPYSLGTARSQANQMFMLFPELGICVKEKGRMVANANSVLLPLINDRLGLGVAPAAVVEEPASEVEQGEEAVAS